MLFSYSLHLILASTASAAFHRLFVGPLLTTSFLYSIGFDDELLTLKILKNQTAYAPHSFITFDHKKRNIFAASFGGGRDFASYSIVDSSMVQLDSLVKLGGNCTDNTVFAIQNPEPPYVVYGQGWPSTCGSVISVDPNGALSSVIQNFTYATGSGAHGAVISSDHRFLYSADLTGNAVWRHSIEPGTGVLRDGFRLEAPEGSGPRHMSVHSGGKYLYVLMETTSEMAVYSLNGKKLKLRESYPIYPPGGDVTQFRGNTVALSATEKYVWASTRSGGAGTGPGYISGWELDMHGAVKKQAATVPTTTVFSRGNGVSPAFFSDKWVAYADYGTGYVQMWRFDANTETMEEVARLDIKDGGCCSNIIWYD